MKQAWIILGAIFAIVILILAIIIFRGGDSSTTDVNTVPKTHLADIASTDKVVRYTYEGPINGEEKHRAVRITVGRNSRTIEVLSGYQGKVIDSKVYDNNQAAYDAFLRALDSDNFTLQRKNANTNLSERDICPTGTRSIIEVLNGSNAEQRLWTTSCGTKSGTFGGETVAIRGLFIEQIPDYSQVANSIHF